MSAIRLNADIVDIAQNESADPREIEFGIRGLQAPDFNLFPGFSVVVEPRPV
jgi:hypothetical protein